MERREDRTAVHPIWWPLRPLVKEAQRCQLLPILPILLIRHTCEEVEDTTLL